MNVYRIRIRLTGEWINKNNGYGGPTNVPRIYDNLGFARNARTQLAEKFARRAYQGSWWNFSQAERQKILDNLLEIVEYECVEKGVVE